MMYIKIWGLSRCNVPYQYLLSITAIARVVQVVTQCVLLGHAKKKFVLKLYVLQVIRVFTLMLEILDRPNQIVHSI